MGYYSRRPYMQAGRTRQANPELDGKIQDALKIPTLTDWEKEFLTSVKESAKKWGRMTAKQHQVFQRIVAKNNPEAIEKRNSWRDSWTDEMREQAIFAANYYEANPPYFSDAAHRILSDDKFVPSEKLFRKMVENKYVQRAKENQAATPKFAAGSMAMVRDSISIARHLSIHRGKLVVVIDVDQNVRSATKGARKLTILPIGSDKMLACEERYLKPARV